MGILLGDAGGWTPKSLMLLARLIGRPVESLNLSCGWEVCVLGECVGAVGS
jgi:hypothetical protein